MALATRRILCSIYAAALILDGVFLAPLALPVLSPEAFIRYLRGFRIPIPEVEHQRLGPLRQQVYADMFGCEEMAKWSLQEIWPHAKHFD
jgi:hypothetical protein